MSDETNETPEFDAKALIEEAFEGVENEDCPMGDECPVHYRIDEEFIDDESEYGRIITYTGEWAVVTTDNPEMENPAILLGILLGKIKQEDIPQPYETCVIKVGAEGTLHDLAALEPKEIKEHVRFLLLHDSWANFKEAHALIVESVKGDLLDLSQPVKEGK